MIRVLDGIRVVSAVIAATILVQCSPPGTTVRMGRSHTERPFLESSLAARSLRPFAQECLSHLGEQVSDDSFLVAWDEEHYGTVSPDDSVPVPTNLRTMFRMFDRYNFRVTHLSPCTFDALRAIAHVPVLALAVTMHFDGKEVLPVEHPERAMLDGGWLSQNAPHVYLSPISRLIDGEKTYAVEIGGNEMVSGKPGEMVEGLVYSSSRETSPVPYRQVVRIVLVSTFDLQPALEEWYGRLPYQPTPPSATPVSF